MRRPHLRFTMRRMMAAVFILALLMVVTIDWFRYRRVKAMVVNQEITLSAAEVNVLNAALQYDNAVSALTKHENELYSNASPSEASYRMLSGLRGLVERSRQRRQDLKEVWKVERLLLKKLRRELGHTWSFWPMRDTSDPDASEKAELSQKELAEIDIKVKHMGQSPIW
jgi:hypothetical protein